MKSELSYTNITISPVLLAIFVFAIFFSRSLAVIQFRLSIELSLNGSKSSIVLFVQNKFRRLYRRKKNFGRTRLVCKKLSSSRLKNAPRTKKDKVADLMTDKNMPEPDASTKNEAKKAGAFDDDLRNSPPVKPVCQ